MCYTHACMSFFTSLFTHTSLPPLSLCLSLFLSLPHTCSPSLTPLPPSLPPSLPGCISYYGSSHDGTLHCRAFPSRLPVCGRQTINDSICLYVPCTQNEEAWRMGMIAKKISSCTYAHSCFLTLSFSLLSLTHTYTHTHTLSLPSSLSLSLSFPPSLSLSLPLSPPHLPPSLQTPTLQHYSGYTTDSLLPLVERLNSMLKTPLSQHRTVRNKYSHE